MRFGTRVFVLCFAPLALLLTFTFFMFQRLEHRAVREGLRSSLEQNQRAIGHALGQGSLRNSRFLRIAGENAALKAGIQLLLSERDNEQARNTVEDQLDELCREMGFDLLLVSAPDGRPLAGVVRANSPSGVSLARLSPSRFEVPDTGLFSLPSPQRGSALRRNQNDGRLFQIASVPVNLGDESLGQLSVGEYFDLGEFSTPVALLHHGRVVASNLDRASGRALVDIEHALRACAGVALCDARIGNIAYVSLPVQGLALGTGYTLRTLENLDAATAPIEHVLHRTWLTVSLCALFAALALSFSASRSVAAPIASMAHRLKKTEATGLLPEFAVERSTIREVQDLMRSFNQAAAAVRHSRDELHAAYVGFIGSLASALDARDPYTAGHSHRVSELACIIAEEIRLEPAAVERIRVGALLHDIGKIGIEDEVLRKPGRLSAAEFALIKQHPIIGRRILEGVQGFAAYLDAVELHHENWDGAGYPYGQAGEQTPIDARIIHVVDAYDAMTTHRPYRQAMSHDQAIEILRRNAATQFDPRIVSAFIAMTNVTPLLHGAEQQQEQLAGAA